MSVPAIHPDAIQLAQLSEGDRIVAELEARLAPLVREMYARFGAFEGGRIVNIALARLFVRQTITIAREFRGMHDPLPRAQIEDAMRHVHHPLNAEVRREYRRHMTDSSELDSVVKRGAPDA